MTYQDSIGQALRASPNRDDPQVLSAAAKAFAAVRAARERGAVPPLAGEHVVGNVVAGTVCTIDPASGNHHFDLVGCHHCLARHLAARPLGWVEERYHQGYIDQPMWEAYCHVWATGAPRFGAYASWAELPTDPEVLALVELLRQAQRARREAAHG